MTTDLTCIFLTANRVPEQWAEFQKETLLKALDGIPVITMSMKPMDWGQNVLQDGEVNANNVYRQLLRAAKLATTKYIAVAEDDSLYSYEHFHTFRPKDDEFGYNLSRWGIFS